MYPTSLALPITYLQQPLIFSAPYSSCPLIPFDLHLYDAPPSGGCSVASSAATSAVIEASYAAAVTPVMTLMVKQLGTCMLAIAGAMCAEAKTHSPPTAAGISKPCPAVLSDGMQWSITMCSSLSKLIDREPH